jgi:hypothetical protein
MVASLAPPGILQICLRMTPLFAGCGDTDIVNLHVTPPIRQPCQNQTLLIEVLADALHLYEMEGRLAERDAQDLRLLIAEDLGRLQGLLETYDLHRSKRSLLHQPKRGLVRKKGREKLSTDMARIMQELMADAGRDIVSNAGYGLGARQTDAMRLHLCDFICSAFRLFGPLKYPNVAVHHALAHILINLGIEHGDEDTVTGRITKRLSPKRLSRSKRSQHPYPHV